MDKNRKSPVSRPVTVSVLPTNGFDLRIDADEAERTALAEAHGLSQAAAFHADLVLKRWRKDGVKVAGSLTARITQQCVVTLAPIETVIETTVDAVFLPEGSSLERPLDDDGALLVDPDGPDAPETFVGGVLDAGAVAEEFFELEIDPYPRAEGAALDIESDNEDGDGRANPFAGLAALRDKL
ncbi:DUF177 domain-containing protein [Oricola sp.]|uniref:DUF177 domain-containing protein n=1 Tax=Oricola sp. TaxID=1979950 RepID=UPI003BACABE8